MQMVALKFDSDSPYGDGGGLSEAFVSEEFPLADNQESEVRVKL